MNGKRGPNGAPGHVAGEISGPAGAVNIRVEVAIDWTQRVVMFRQRRGLLLEADEVKVPFDLLNLVGAQVTLREISARGGIQVSQSAEPSTPQ